MLLMPCLFPTTEMADSFTAEELAALVERLDIEKILNQSGRLPDIYGSILLRSFNEFRNLQS